MVVLGVKYFILGLTAAVVSRCDNLATKGSKKFGETSTSLLINKIYFPWADFKPKLFPPANPKFLSLQIRLTSGYWFLITEASSFEALSTTIISTFL